MRISEKFLKEYPLKRYSQGTFTNGEFSPGSFENLMIKGSVQPLTPEQIKFYSEGERKGIHLNFYSNDFVQTINESMNRRSDEITIRGETYKVVEVKVWDFLEITHYESVLYRETNQ